MYSYSKIWLYVGSSLLLLGNIFFKDKNLRFLICECLQSLKNVYPQSCMIVNLIAYQLVMHTLKCIHKMFCLSIFLTIFQDLFPRGYFILQLCCAVVLLNLTFMLVSIVKISE